MKENVGHDSQITECSVLFDKKFLTKGCSS